MGVDARVEGQLVRLHATGRIGDGDALGWTEHVREAARASGGPVLILVVLDRGMDVAVPVLAAAARQTFGVLPQIRAAALVGLGDAELTMLRATTLAVSPPNPVEFFADEASARAWLERVASSPKGATAVASAG